ncbi:hypothetical protein QL285_027329 [Trifolium repens]|nr:hypothetical protein QL285_027329 [Trifolium repens]
MMPGADHPVDDGFDPSHQPANVEAKVHILCYYGQNQFFMLIDNNSNHERLSFFPPFHSLSTSLQHYRSFFMRIGVEDLTSTQLVLRQDLGNFLASTGHFRIKVSGPWDYVVTIRLIVNRENGRRVKFGQGWTTFCHLHQIASGNVLNFKAACTIEYSNILIVRIV